jgi:hypothetical protein
MSRIRPAPNGTVLPARAAWERRPRWPRRHARVLAGGVTTLLTLVVLVLSVVGWVGSERAIHPEATDGRSIAQ